MKQSAFFNSLPKTKTELKDEEQTQECPLEFVPHETDDELSDVMYNKVKIGELGTNLTGLMTEYFKLYHETELTIKMHSPKEMDKNYSLDDLKGLVKKQDEMAVDIIIYQAGLKAFNHFKEIIVEEDSFKCFNMARALVKEVNSHVDALVGKEVYVTQKNIKILNILVEKLNNMAKQLETFELNKKTKKILGLEKAVGLYLGKKSKDARIIASTFQTAIKGYEGENALLLIPSINKVKKEAKLSAASLKKAEKKSSFGKK